MRINIFSAYFIPLLRDINHPALLQKWKLNLDTSAYERNIDATMSKILIKHLFIVLIATCTGHPQKMVQLSSLLLSQLWNILQIF